MQAQPWKQGWAFLWFFGARRGANPAPKRKAASGASHQESRGEAAISPAQWSIGLFVWRGVSEFPIIRTL